MVNQDNTAFGTSTTLSGAAIVAEANLLPKGWSVTHN